MQGYGARQTIEWTQDTGLAFELSLHGIKVHMTTLHSDGSETIEWLWGSADYRKQTIEGLWGSADCRKQTIEGLWGSADY